MSLLRRLFGRNAPQASSPIIPVPEPAFTFIGARFVRVPSCDFFGQYARSSNRRFLLAWRDRMTAVDADGTRRTDPGRYLVFDGDSLVAEGVLDRPHDGKVANDGRFIVNDWEDAAGLQGSFYAFRADGTLVLKRRFTANLLNNCLAGDGRLAACQTCNAPGSPDSSILVLFDLDAGTEIAAWEPRSGWAATYDFPDTPDRIALCYEPGGCFLYRLDGTFLDEARWITSQLRTGALHVVKEQLAFHGDALPPAIAADIVTGLTLQLEAPHHDPRDRAYVLRLFGQCREAEGDDVEALCLYREAIALNPKIGLKRKIEQLTRAQDPRAAG